MTCRVLALLAVLASCYSPELSDCALPCASSADCANDQVCTAANLCAAASLSCASAAQPVDASGSPTTPPPPPPRDASVPPPDAAMVDAGPPTTALVTISITGTGSVALAGAMCLSADAGGNGTIAPCTVEVPIDKPATAMAMSKGGSMFQSWTSQVCAGQMQNCMFTPTGPTAIAAQFSTKKN